MVAAEPATIETNFSNAASLFSNWLLDSCDVTLSIDLEKDKLHPAKSHRPLPSGKLSVSTAAAAALVVVATYLIDLVVPLA